VKNSTILQLNQLNLNFYSQVSAAFDESRSHAWDGWRQLVEPLSSLAEINLLDIGCGNGRFGQFLAEQNLPLKTYVGLDSNQELLQSAAKGLSRHNIDHQLIKTDLVEDLLGDGLPLTTPQSKPNLVVLFGLLHHIPSLELRLKLVRLVANELETGGIMVFTLWLFNNFHRFHKKYISPSEINIKSDELEEGDYLLNWLRGEEAIRYCHYADRIEIESLVESTKLKIVSTYTADGREGDLNQYIILKKV
jgi:tRNA (uracil-5-)-methyltransferase TRM9